MNSFILRLYRVDTIKPEKMTGTLENVETQKIYVFKGQEELWELIKEQSPDREPVVG